MEDPPPVTPLVGSVIDAIGMGPYQVKEAALSSGVWLADGAELLLIGSVTRAVAQEWDLTATQKGAVVSIVFAGVFAGNLISGPCADRFGRRWPVLMSYAAVGIFSMLSAFTLGFGALSISRFCVGLAFGFGQPASSTYCLEIAPKAWRTFVYCIGGYLFIIGEAYSAFLIMLDDPTMKHLDWRWLLIMGALPAFVLTFVAAAFLNESPSWLAARGKEEEAREVLAKMNRTNGSHCPRLEFCVSQEEPNKSGFADIKKDLGVIFGPAMLYTTLVSCFTTFVMNIVFYGGLYAFPQVLSESVETGASPAFTLLMGALWEAPGYVLVLAFDRAMGRRLTLIVGLLTLTTCVLAFVHGGSQDHESGPEYYMVHCGYAGYKCFASVVIVVVYQYSAEIYPVNCRVAGNALSIAMGRIGAITSSLLYEWLTEISGTWTMFFHILACFLVFDAILIAFLPFETQGKVLKESADDSNETEPLCPCWERTKQT